MAELIQGAERQKQFARKKTGMQEEFFWGIGQKALYHMTRAEYTNEPDKIAIKN